MKAVVGRYFFGKHYGNWGIWQYDHVSKSGTNANYIKDVFSYEDAVKKCIVLMAGGNLKQFIEHSND